MIFAAAPSQNEMLESLLRQDLDFSRINAFHMDEYVGLDAAHPAGFRNYLKRTVFDRLPLGSVNLINGNAEDPEEEARRYGQLLAAHPADICLLGCYFENLMLNKDSLQVMHPWLSEAWEEIRG